MMASSDGSRGRSPSPARMLGETLIMSPIYGALRIRVLQRDGGKAITAADYLNGRPDLRDRKSVV